MKWEILEQLKTLASTAFAAGVSGAIVSLAFDIRQGEKKPSFLNAMFSIFAGGVIAQYSEEMARHYFPTFPMFIAFVLGMIGLVLVGGIINLAKAFAADPLGFIGKFRGGKK